MVVDTQHIGIQMKRKELTKIFMMISNWKTPFGRHVLYKKMSTGEIVNMDLLFRNNQWHAIKVLFVRYSHVMIALCVRYWCLTARACRCHGELR